MADKHLLLYAYLDGELPQDLRESFESLLAVDTSLRAEFEAARKCHGLVRQDALKAGAALEARLPWVKESMWARLESTRKAVRPPRFWERVVALPLPVLAAMALAVLGLGSLGWVLRPTSSSALAVQDIPDLTLGASGIDSGTTKASFSLPLATQEGGLEITIKVDDIDQLLRLLEGVRSEKDVLISMPKDAVLQSLGEPLFLPADEEGAR